MTDTGQDVHPIKVEVDGAPERATVSSRTLLVHWLRDELDKRGPKIGCDTGNCGACTVRWNGALVKSCMVLAVQADGDTVETAADLTQDGTLSPLQQSFKDHHALQCGYCTSGMLLAATDVLESGVDITEESIRRGLKGNLCRCTGYHNIVKAVQAAAGHRVSPPHGAETERGEA